MARSHSVGESVVQALEANGVQVVFGIPGTHNLELYRGLAASGIRHISPQHEQGGGYAADGYARSSGKPGTLITTSGPGILNALSALATSYADSVPVLALSPGPPTGMERRDIGWLHEVKDQRAAVDAVVERSVRCHTAEEAISAVNATFAQWRIGRTRPVHIELPVDLLDSGADAAPVRAYPSSDPPTPPKQRIDEALQLISRARRPLIVAGGGSVGAGEQLSALAVAIGAPVITTVAGKAVLAESNSLSGGVALPYASAKLSDADLVVVVGSELAEVDGGLSPFGADARLIRIDIRAGQLHKPRAADVALWGAADTVLDLVLAGRPGSASTVSEAISRASRIKEAVRASSPRWIALHQMLAEVLPDNAIVCGDSSQVSYLGTAPILQQDVPRRFLYPNGFATLGYAIPAAIGAQIAHSEATVMAVLGDGALMFSVQELVTAHQYRLPITAVVVDNGGYGEIREQMRRRDIPPLGVDFVVPDTVALARACGWDAARADSLPALAGHLRTAIAARRPSMFVISEYCAQAN
ncbi:thiamine pyrophosphate-binding protein [Mycolicibacterium mengxianglii]|uniref:thiamine pyrophosphate-binding protein n=1 Tax=Mycolicibacterium mengxianglii TaxID=2736649 RepID=UPI001E5A3D62|nr:thiamine pyrophosphate-binding protein [Mycolicibacterium mengxianglii]